ncbi:acid phosphatase 1-like [Mercurialis annua]|uniref:acid phosphatase 1-like n=1 Tax=Mercurialis annua TaxID=3986 RepID=UPI00215F95A5|nr:acid phosphatase 1-like [Mercurialis annua]
MFLVLLLLLVAATLSAILCFMKIGIAISYQGLFADQIDNVSRETERIALVNCLSWRVANEANNIIGWWKVPKGCEGYVKEYLLGYGYRSDSKVVIDEAINYVETLGLPEDGRSIWIFDIDETVLSNVHYFIEHELSGIDPSFSTPEAEVLRESWKLYNKLLFTGIKIVFLTGRKENKRESTVSNLKKAGYHTWNMLILKSDGMANKTAREYKSSIRADLEKKGYRIVGNIGDQWSDLLGGSAGRRSFKLPNPMYYIP